MQNRDEQDSRDRLTPAMVALADACLVDIGIPIETARAQGFFSVAEFAAASGRRRESGNRVLLDGVARGTVTRTKVHNVRGWFYRAVQQA